MVSLIGRLGVRDVLIGVDLEGNGLTGDAREMCGTDVGGDDLLVSIVTGQGPDGGPLPAFSFLTGDAQMMSGNSQGGDDVLIATRGGTVYLRGDAHSIIGNAQGGDDLLVGAEDAFSNVMVGDAENLGDESEYPTDGTPQGGNDLLIGGNDGSNHMYGDTLQLVRNANAGNDTLIGGDNSVNIMRGDAQDCGTTGSIGADVLIGGRHARNEIAGDGNWLGGATGGNDLLRGGNHSDNRLQGDAKYLYSTGGNDTLIASDTGTNELCGDAYQMLGRARGGDDILISGRGDDQLWGDAKFRSGIYLGEATEEDWYEYPPRYDYTTTGSDIFVFKRGNGDDTIHDFVSGEDLIDLQALGTIDGFGDLQITEADGNSVISLGRGNSITVIGIEALGESDFLFG